MESAIAAEVPGDTLEREVELASALCQALISIHG